jgi:DNA-binding GntR family transcriptional regulator
MTIARWRQIADELRERITEGRYPVGSKLPPITDLQKEFDVAGLNTIRSAQQLLAQQGLLEIRQGIGATVVAQTPVTSRTTLLAQLREARAANQRLAATLDDTIALLEQEARE